MSNAASLTFLESGMASIGILLSLAVGLVQSSPDLSPRWGEPEIIGATELQKGIVRTALADLQGNVDIDAIESQAGSRCKTIKRATLGVGVVRVNCSIVQIEGKNFHVVVDIVQRGEEARIAFLRTKWHLFELDELSESDVEKRLVQCTLDCQDESKRATAFEELQRLASSQPACYAAYNGLRDPSVRARNYAAQYLNRFLGPCLGFLGAEKLLFELGTLIQRPNHSDRNKGIATIQLIAAQKELDAPCELLAIRNPVASLAAQSILSNVGGTAKNVLATIDLRAEELRLACEHSGVVRQH